MIIDDNCDNDDDIFFPIIPLIILGGPRAPIPGKCSILLLLLRLAMKMRVLKRSIVIMIDVYANENDWRWR